MDCDNDGAVEVQVGDFVKLKPQILLTESCAHLSLVNFCVSPNKLIFKVSKRRSRLPTTEKYEGASCRRKQLINVGCTLFNQPLHHIKYEMISICTHTNDANL